MFIFILWLFATLIHSASSLWSWMEKTLTIANKHHNTSSTWQQKQRKSFFFNKFFPFRWLFFYIEKLLDVMENHFAMSTMRKSFFFFISFWLLTIYLRSILLVNLKLLFFLFREMLLKFSCLCICIIIPQQKHFPPPCTVVKWLCANTRECNTNKKKYAWIYISSFYSGCE